MTLFGIVATVVSDQWSANKNAGVPHVSSLLRDMGAKRAASIANPDDLCAYPSAFNHQYPHADRQFKPSRSGAAGIEVEHAAAPLLHWPVAVPEDDHMEPGGLRLEVKPREIVQDIDRHAADFHDLGVLQFASPGALVDVAANSRYRDDGAKLVQNLGRAHVASLNDMLRSMQGRERFGPQQAVRVRNDANKNDRCQVQVLGLRLLLPTSAF